MPPHSRLSAIQPDPAGEAGRLPDSRQDAGATTPAPSTADILKFLIDRTGYIKLLGAGRHARGLLPH